MNIFFLFVNCLVYIHLDGKSNYGNIALVYFFLCACLNLAGLKVHTQPDLGSLAQVTQCTTVSDFTQANMLFCYVILSRNIMQPENDAKIAHMFLACKTKDINLQ